MTAWAKCQALKRPAPDGGTALAVPSRTTATRIQTSIAQAVQHDAGPPVFARTAGV
jgi:hypothetical protein